MDQAKAGQATSTSLFGDFSKLIEQFKLPGIDLNALMEARRKDIDALAAANRTALVGIQSLNQKQAEILRATMDQLQSIVKTAAGSATSVSLVEIAQQALQKAFLSIWELAEVAYKSQSDAFAVVIRIL